VVVKGLLLQFLSLDHIVAQFCRVIFGMLVSLPLLVGFYIVLELIR
jgi:hypothetical protein